MDAKGANKSFENVLFHLDFWLIAFSLVILKLPVLFGQRYNLLFYAPFLLPFLAAIFLRLVYLRISRLRIRLEGKLPLPLILFWGFWLLALARTALSELSFDTFYIAGYVFSLFVLGGYTLLAYWTSSENNSRCSQLRRAMVFAFVIFIASNLLFYFTGIAPKEDIYLAKYPVQMLSLLGITMNRVLFAMSDGINNFGVLAGATFVTLVPLIWVKGKVHKTTIAILLLSCLIAMLLTDSRGAILFTLITLAIIKLPRGWFRFARWLPFILSALPIFIMLVAPSVIAENTSWLNRPETDWGNDPVRAGLTSPCEDNVALANGSLSNRPVIWNIALRELGQPAMIHLIGYGYRGHVVSGMSEQYACLFESFVKAKMASVHNIWLQSALSIGYVGLAASLLFLNVLMGWLDKLYIAMGDPVYRGLLATVIYIICVGALEASISPDFYGHFVFLLFMTIIVIVDSAKHAELQPGMVNG
jgi:hypothetical protein